MFDLFAWPFDTSGFVPRWQCGDWAAGVGWLHILSDLGVWSAYFAIPLVLGFFASRKRDLPFRRLVLLFTAFILACGTTHLLDAAVFWWPAYRLAGLMKGVTAVVSWVTVLALVRAAPRLWAMRSPEELEREVAARRAAEAELGRANAALAARAAASEEKYRQLFDLNPQPMWVFDQVTLRFLAVNPAACRHYGYTAAEFLGMTLKDIRPPADVPALLAKVAAPPAGYDDAGVWRHRTKDGRVIRVWVVSHPLTFDGRPAEVVLAQDVTARLAAEADLRASEERLQLALTAGRMGTFDWDLRTDRIVWSRSHYELLGYDPGAGFAVEYRHFADRVHPADRAELEEKVRAALLAGGEFDHEYRLVWPTGRRRWHGSSARRWTGWMGSCDRQVTAVPSGGRAVSSGAVYDVRPRPFRRRRAP